MKDKEVEEILEYFKKFLPEEHISFLHKEIDKGRLNKNYLLILYYMHRRFWYEPYGL